MQHDERNQAHYLAAVAVAAHEFGLHVDTLALAKDLSVTPSIVLEPLDEYCSSDDDSTYWKTVLIGEYLTVLLSGGIGELIFRRSQQSQILRAYDGVRLEWDCLCRALACSTKEADMAFAIILGRLKSVDGGDPSATIYRLWSRANGLLMEPPKRKRVVRLAAYLRQQGKVKGADICQFLKA